MPASVDIGTFSCTIIVDTGTCIFFTNIVRYWYVSCVAVSVAILGRFTYQITLLYSSYTDPHGFSERVPLKHDPTYAS